METVIEALKASPGLLALLAAIWLFMKQLERQDVRNSALVDSIDKRNAALIEKVTQTAERTQERATNAIERNIESLAVNTASNREVTAGLVKLSCKWADQHQPPQKKT